MEFLNKAINNRGNSYLIAKSFKGELALLRRRLVRIKAQFIKKIVQY
tara:strand:+ start:26589 stop:26729 length:141 start_codon:yes stop_codon:yes gene_type:complete